jgi:hypothetical protein
MNKAFFEINELFKVSSSCMQKDQAAAVRHAVATIAA